MKNKISLFLTISFVLSTGLSAVFAQRPGSPFKGTINYKITYPDSKMEATQLAMLPQTMKVRMNGNKARIEMSMSGINQVIIMDADQQSTVFLVDMMGQKIAMKPNKGADKPSGKEPVVTVASETKEIAGFACKKAEIHFGDEKSKASPMIVYFTEDIGNNKLFYDNEYRTLPGIPMEFFYKMQGMNMYMTAVSVEKGKVSAKEFEVPSDYKEMTPEQLRQSFGGN